MAIKKVVSRLPCRQAGKSSVVKKNFGRIGILMGGPSSEREISLKSGKAIYESLKSMPLEVVSIDITTDDILQNSLLLRQAQISCAFLALHGRFGEDGTIQGLLDNLKIPYTGSGKEASRLAMDKVASRKIFAQEDLFVPRYCLIEKDAPLEISPEGVKGLSLPIVVKPATHGSSIGLSIVGQVQDLKQAIELAFSFDDRVILEEYIKGRELTVGILDERALPVIEIIPKRNFFDFQAKYQAGLTDYVVPAQLDKEVTRKVQAAALKAHQTLGCFGCSRVDIILTDNRPIILEANTIPGFTQTSLLPKAASVAGIEFGELCLKLINLAYEKK